MNKLKARNLNTLHLHIYLFYKLKLFNYFIASINIALGKSSKLFLVAEKNDVCVYI